MRTNDAFPHKDSASTNPVRPNGQGRTRYLPYVAVEVTPSGLMITLVDRPHLTDDLYIGLHAEDVVAFILRSGDWQALAPASPQLLRMLPDGYIDLPVIVRCTDAYGEVTDETLYTASNEFAEQLRTLTQIGPNRQALARLQAQLDEGTTIRTCIDERLMRMPDNLARGRR